MDAIWRQGFDLVFPSYLPRIVSLYTSEPPSARKFRRDPSLSHQVVKGLQDQ